MLSGNVACAFYNQTPPLDSTLSILHIGPQISETTVDCADTYLAGAWENTKNDKYGPYTIKKNAKKATYESLTVLLSQQTAKFVNPDKNGDIFRFIAWGKYSMIMPYGYPFVQWAPKEHELKIHNLNQAIKPPKLQVLPPDSLTTSRQKSLWKVCGDLHASFALYTNPTHAESKKGLKTKALIYLPTLKKWKNLDLDGTECYPMYFGD